MWKKTFEKEWVYFRVNSVISCDTTARHLNQVTSVISMRVICVRLFILAHNVALFQKLLKHQCKSSSLRGEAELQVIWSQTYTIIPFCWLFYYLKNIPLRHVFFISSELQRAKSANHNTHFARFELMTIPTKRWKRAQLNMPVTWMVKTTNYSFHKLT